MRKRILQVVGGMDMGGVETWLMHVLRNIDRGRYQIDFLVQNKTPCAYDDEIRTLGSHIIPCLGYRKPWVFARNFARALEKNGPYDVVHSHVHHYSGFVLRLAAHHKVPIRIAHSHNDLTAMEAHRGPLRQLYLRLMKHWIKQYATFGLAASAPAAISLFGSHWQNDSCWQILPCGLDFSPFNHDVDSQAIRKELGIPLDARVIGHVGRFSVQKNHTFLLDVGAEILQQDPQAWLLLIGEGSLKPVMEEKSRQLRISHRVTFAGLRDDVPRIMKGAMDVFLLPSKWEGLGLVLVEAQAAGIPCVISDVIPEEADVVSELVTRLSVEQPVENWAEAVLSATHKQQVSQKVAINKVVQSPFNIQHSVMNLEKLYTPYVTSMVGQD